MQFQHTQHARRTALKAGAIGILGLGAGHLSQLRAENEEAKKIMDEQGFANAIIVSDPHHLRRASMHARRQGVKAITDPTPTSRYKGFKAIAEQIAKEGYLITRLLVMDY